MLTRRTLTHKWLVLTYFLSRLEVSRAQTVLERVSVTENKPEPGASLNCPDTTRISIVDIYGTTENGSLFDIQSSLYNVCNCKQHCDIPAMEPTGFSQWILYVRFSCKVYACITQTHSATASPSFSNTSAIFMTKESVNAESSIETINSNSIRSGATQSATTLKKIEITSKTVSSTSADDDSMTRMTSHQDGIVFESVSTIVASACLFVVGITCGGIGFVLYRRHRSAKDKSNASKTPDQTFRKELPSISLRHNIGEMDDEQHRPQGAPKLDDGYESVNYNHANATIFPENISHISDDYVRMSCGQQAHDDIAPSDLVYLHVVQTK